MWKAALRWTGKVLAISFPVMAIQQLPPTARYDEETLCEDAGDADKCPLGTRFAACTAATQNEHCDAEIACIAKSDGTAERHPQNSVNSAHAFEAWRGKLNATIPVRCTIHSANGIRCAPR